VIGEPITVAAGLLREPLPMFVLLVSLANIGRYLVIAAVTLCWT
jgi:membrane protein YqaA with SNARE-associated domain